MESELDIIDSLKAMRYQGSCLKNEVLTSALEEGPRSPDFREVVCWLTQELHVLRKTDEKVDKEVVEPSEFAMELSAMLKELGCPYEKFLAGALSERFESKQSCMDLLEYLITELMAIKMSLKLKPVAQTYVINKFETDTARAMEMLTKDIGLGKPPENVSPKAFFDKINFKVEELLRIISPNIICAPLMKTKVNLTEAQWKKLDEIHADLDAEYNMRRQVLLTRLEVTIQSFQWADRMRNRENEIVQRFQKKFNELDEFKYGGKDTNIIALLAARSDLAIIEKTSSANVRKNTGTRIHKHVIGSVPDRGGRAHEHAPPPPEMPSWQQQRAGGPGGGGGGFRGGRGGGGFGGGGSGRDGGGAGNWQQYASQGQQQKGQYSSRPQQYEQRPQFEQGQDRNWISGTGRVQGANWSQKGNDRDRGSNDDYHQQQHGSNRGQSGGYQGRQNYNNRGGGGGGGSNYRR